MGVLVGVLGVAGALPPAFPGLVAGDLGAASLPDFRAAEGDAAGFAAPSSAAAAPSAAAPPSFGAPPSSRLGSDEPSSVARLSFARLLDARRLAGAELGVEAAGAAGFSTGSAPPPGAAAAPSASPLLPLGPLPLNSCAACVSGSGETPRCKSRASRATASDTFFGLAAAGLPAASLPSLALADGDFDAALAAGLPVGGMTGRARSCDKLALQNQGRGKKCKMSGRGRVGIGEFVATTSGGNAVQTAG